MDMFYGGDPNIPLTSLDGSVTACAASPIPEGYLDPSPISIDAKLVSPEGRLELQATNNNAWPESGYSETNPDPGMLSEEALLLNSTDFLSFPSFDFSNLSEHTGDGSDIPILSRDNNSNFFQIIRLIILIKSVPSPLWLWKTRLFLIRSWQMINPKRNKKLLILAKHPIPWSLAHRLFKKLLTWQ